jgi:hypothetical protein
MRDKFMDCAEAIGPADWAERLFAQIETFDTAPTLAPMLALMARAD